MMAKKTTKPKTVAGPDLSHIAEQLRPLAVDVNDIELDPANARAHGESNLAAIRGSLRSFGQVKPIIVNAKTRIVEAGNGTLVSARKLGWTHIAAVFVEHDAAQSATFAIVDNRTSELATWNDDALASLIHACDTTDDDLREMLTRLAEDEGVIPGLEQGENDPNAEWQGMPEFEQDDKTSAYRVIVHFATLEDHQAFGKLIGQTLTEKTVAIWHPKAAIVRYGEV